MAGGPRNEVMERALGPHADVLIKQSKRGWLMECLCPCEANQEYNIATKDHPKQDIMYAEEHTNCCCRCCCGKNRPLDIIVTEGAKSGGAHVLTAHRPLRCPLGPCMCCCRQEMQAYGAADKSQASYTGKVLAPFFCCIPMLSMFDAQGTHKYDISPPACCCGLCLSCCDPCCTCRVPFYITRPGDRGGDHLGVIEKQYGGVMKEVFTDADTFGVKFPADATLDDKSTLVAATFLLDMAFFESDKSEEVAGNA